MVVAPRQSALYSRFGPIVPLFWSHRALANQSWFRRFDTHFETFEIYGLSNEISKAYLSIICLKFEYNYHIFVCISNKNLGAESKRRPNFEYASTVLFEGLTFRTWSSLVAFGGIGACHSLIVKALESGYRITLFSHTFSSDSSIVSSTCSSPKRLYTTIENPSYFFMTFSCTEAIQSFSSHFNQYSLVDPSWGNIPSWVWRPGGVLPMWWVIHMCRGFDPLFSLWQDRAWSFWGIFLIHQQQSYLLGYKNYQFLQKSIFLAPNSIFSSIFLGPIFSGQRHTPISFQAEYPPGVWRGVSHWLYGAEFDTTAILETEFHENNSIFISYPDKHKHNWKIVSTMNVTYAPIQINWARNIASNYFIQQQPASSFTTVSTVMVLLCELCHQ